MTEHTERTPTSLQTRIGHHGWIAGALPAIALLMVIDGHYRLAGALMVIRIGVYLLQRRHSRVDCPLCLELILRPEPTDDELRSLPVWAHHHQFLILGIGAVAAIASSRVVGSWTFIPVWMAFQFLLDLGQHRHRIVEPWCIWCGDDGDDGDEELEPEPTPDPAGQATR